jgi:hypothetical protein
MSLALAFSALALASGGVAMMLGQGSFGSRLLAAALIVAVAEGLMAGNGEGSGFFHAASRLICWLTVSSLCLAILRGADVVRTLLLSVASFLLWALAMQSLALVPIWLWPLLVLLLAAALPVIALRAVRSVVARLFGDEAAGHLLGTWLVRGFDFLGRALVRRRRPPGNRRRP